MFRSPIKKFSYLEALLAGCIAGVILVSGWMIYIDGSRHQAEQLAAITWSVHWPIENAQLSDMQTFVIKSDSPNRDDAYEIKWAVDDSIRSGVLNYAEGQYQSTINVSEWDWNSNGQHLVAFEVIDRQTNEVVKKWQIPVFTNGFVYSGTDESGVATTTPVLSNEIMSGVDTGSKVIADPAPQVLGSSSFRVEWIAGPIEQNQKFVIHIDKVIAESVNVFWNVEGGHNNHIYLKDGKFETAININGWRWKGAGPYPVTFSIVDKKSSALLESETLDFSWKGVPGESEISMKSQGVSRTSAAIATAASNSTSNTIGATSESTTTGNKAAATKTTPIKPVSNSQVTKVFSQQVVGSKFLNRQLLSVKKPAVTQSITQSSTDKQKTAVEYILSQPNSTWLNGDGYDSDEYLRQIFASAAQEKRLPVFVLYNIPHRDCGSYSSGGAKNAQDYRAWIDRIAKAFSGKEALVIVEPDSLAQLNCAPEESRTERLELISYAAEKLSASSVGVNVYLDAGHPYWVNSAEMARRLDLAGVKYARGFSLNVSNFIGTKDNLTYGNHLSSLLGGNKHFVVDTSRNGNGASTGNEWCNPSGRALGPKPQLVSGEGMLDAYLWIKFPGESDGYCNGAPGPGAWWLDYAVGLYYNRIP